MMRFAGLTLVPGSAGGTRGVPGGAPDSAGPQAALFATPILIIEDEALIAWMIEDILQTAGFTALAIAPDSRHALAAAGRAPPGLIVSDVNLGVGADGIATARALIAGRAAPVIFVTGYADDTMRARLAVELPAAQLLRKPVDPAALLRAVMRALAN